MIGKLRRRFVAMGFLAAFTVLAVLLATALGLSYKQVLTDTDRVIDLIAQSGGIWEKQNATDGEDELGPETFYETRYFTVWLDQKGKLNSLNAVNVSSINTATAKSYAEEVFRQKQARGTKNSFRFGAYSGPAGYMLVFVDMSKQLATFSRFLRSSLVVALGSLLSISILLALFSSRAVRPIAESYEKQKRFITDAGHELKTPLTIIDADCTVLEMEGEDNEWVRDIQLQTKRMSRLTQDLIYLTRMEEDGPGLQNLPFSLSDLARDIIQEFQAPALASKREVKSQIPDYLTARGDEKEIRKLLSILLKNALSYADGEGPVEVICEKTGKSILISVRNPAENLPDQAVHHLFDRFFRADPSRHSDTGGSGLGLAIAEAIVAAHQGNIYAEKHENNVLEVVVKLPQ